MLQTLATICFFGAAVVVLGEILRYQKLITNETSRKMIHLAHCFVVASWPFFLGYRVIIGAEVLFILVVLSAQQIALFKPLWLINRKSWGELFLPAGVILLCLMQLPAWMFAAALLHAGLADALAALLGKRLKSQAYKVWGQQKSIAGSLVFATCSVLILLVAFKYLVTDYTLKQFGLSLLFIPPVTTLTENISPRGSDNVLVPLVVVGLLRVIGLA